MKSNKPSDVIPCEANAELRVRINEFAETLRMEAHTLGLHGLSENEFYQSGLFRGAIERLRGQFSAAMREKRDFVKLILNYMQDLGFVRDWESAGDSNRHDYVVHLNDGKRAAIELKGCLDGNNTNIFERPPHVDEFIIWSVCSNPGADPRHNAWSGIHTRLSAEIISRSQRVDGLVVWDWICGTIGRPCPKQSEGIRKTTMVGPFEVPPPCIYLFPASIPSPRNNPSPKAQLIEQLGILNAFHQCFAGDKKHLSLVDFDVHYKGAETMRTTTITRNGVAVRKSQPTPIQRS